MSEERLTYLDANNSPLEKGFYVNKETLSFSLFIGEYNEINWPIFENEHGIHYPSPSAIAKFWIGIKNPKELIIELRHDANWIESKLEVEVKQREENEKRDGWLSITQYMDIKRSEWD